MAMGCSSGLGRREPAVLGIARMRAGGQGRGVRLEGGIVELLEADPRGVEAHDRVLAHELEEGPAFLLARALAIPVGERLEQRRLIRNREVAEWRALELARMGVEPGEAVAEAVLHGGV